MLKILGLAGFALSLILAPLGMFNPTLFGGSLLVASGGVLGDAWRATRPEPGE